MLKVISVLFACVVVAVAPAVTQGSASVSALSKDQAFARASTCLKNHGAHAVIPRSFNRGGLAQYGSHGTNGTAAFQYVLRGDLAIGVKLQIMGSNGPTRYERQWAQRCVTWGVPLVR